MCNLQYIHNMSDIAIKASTQEHLDIYTILDNLVFLKDGSVSLVLQTTAINFGLLSEDEQDATIYSYSGLINSLSFPIQIVIRSVRKDVSEYLDFLDERIQQVSSQKVKEQVIKYRQFIKSMVKDNKVMEKKFYVAIPFSVVELGLSAKSFNPFTKAPQKPPFDVSYIKEKASLTLNPRRDHLIRQFARLGVKAKQLSTSELIALYYNTYNPAASTYTLLNTNTQENFTQGTITNNQRTNVQSEIPNLK